jgi:hypothetical protein
LTEVRSVIGKALLNLDGANALLIQPDLTAVRFSLMLTYFDQKKELSRSGNISLLYYLALSCVLILLLPRATY